MKKIILTILFILFYHTSFADTQSELWQLTLSSHFDIAESFNTTNDWPVSSGDAPFIVQQSLNTPTSGHLPTRTDASASPINVYSWYMGSYTPPTTDWVMDHRASGGQIWNPNGGDGKSVCVDLSSRQSTGLGDGINHGPSHLGIQFSNGDRTHGYNEFYVFVMYYIPKSFYPTSKDADSNIGVYTDDQPYLYSASTKIATVGIGFNGINRHADDSNNGWSGDYSMDHVAGRATTYGWVSKIFHITPSSGGYKPRFVIQGNFIMGTSVPVPSFYSEIDTASKQQLAGVLAGYVDSGQWRGFELHYKKNTANNEDGVFESWDYLPGATPGTYTKTKVHTLTNIFYMINSLQADKFNNFFLGGNNSSQWQWGNTMDPKMYFDDLILDDSPIGDTYFSLVAGETPVVNPTLSITAHPDSTDGTSTVTGTAITPDGTMSSVTCTEGFTVTTSDNYAHWSCSVVGLSYGTTTLHFTATGSNGGVTSGSTTVYYPNPAYASPTITGPDDFSTTASSVEIEGTYTVDPNLPDQSVIVTWTLGGNYGFCVSALGIFSCTVPDIALGANNIVFNNVDSNSGAGNDTTVVTRTPPPSGNVIYTGSMSGGSYR